MKKVVFKINILICVYLYSFYFSSIVFYLILLYANQTIIKLGFFLITVHATISYFQYNL